MCAVCKEPCKENFENWPAAAPNEFGIMRGTFEAMSCLFAEARRKDTPSKTFWAKWSHVGELFLPRGDARICLESTDYRKHSRQIRNIMRSGVFGEKFVGKASKEIALEDFVLFFLYY